MLVFVDSNQFISDFQLESAPMRYLFHFLNNDGHSLLLSRLVIQEVENKYREKTKEALVEAEKLADRFARLGMPDKVGAPKTVALPTFDLYARLRERVDQIQVIEYEKVQHLAVVERALKRRRPFDADGDGGYRDTLIWFSLLESLRCSKGRDEEVVFISENWTDFYEKAPSKDSKGKAGDDGRDTRVQVQFHDHLKDDLRLLGRAATPYMSVSAFVDTKVDKEAHAVDYGRQEEAFETYVENEGIDYLGSMPSSIAKDLAIDLFGPRVEALTFLSTDADVTEGLEDLSVQVSQELDGEDYISCTYNIRGVSLDLHVADSRFDQVERAIEAHEQVWEVVRLEGTVVIRILTRPYFTASFRFNRRTSECSGYSVSELKFR